MFRTKLTKMCGRICTACLLKQGIMGGRSRSWARWKILQKRSLVQTLIFIVMLLFFPLLIIRNFIVGLTGSQLLQCYRSTENRIPDLQENLVPVGQAFFFHETSCSSNNETDITVNARQACAVESAALHHPHNLVYLLIPSPVRTMLNETKNKAIQALLEYSNIRINHISLEKYLENTPMDILLTGLRRSSYPVSHVSDVLRYTTLYKFLGTYLDLDVIILESLHKFNNYAGAESDRSLGAGLINFNNDQVGRTMAVECAEELHRTFDGNDWGNNGPGVLSRVLRRKCKKTGVLEMIDADCQGFHVLPTNKIYAFPFWESTMFFKSGQLANSKNIVNNSIAIHYWNRVSSKFSIPQGDLTVPFLYYAKMHCPFVYRAANGTF